MGIMGMEFTVGVTLKTRNSQFGWLGQGLGLKSANIDNLLVESGKTFSSQPFRLDTQKYQKT